MRQFGGIGGAWFVATIVAVTIAAAAVGSVRSEVTDVPTALGVSAQPALAQGSSEELPDSSDPGPSPERAELDYPDELRLETEPSTPTTIEITIAAEAAEPSTGATAVPADSRTPSEEGAKSLPQGGSTSTTSSAPAKEPSTTSTTRPAVISSTKPPATPTTTSPTTTSTTTTTSAPTPTTTTTSAPQAYTRAIETKGGSLTVRVLGDAVNFKRAFPNSGWRFDIASEGPETVEARFTRTDDRSVRIRVLAMVIDGELDVAIASSR